MNFISTLSSFTDDKSDFNWIHQRLSLSNSSSLQLKIMDSHLNCFDKSHTKRDLFGSLIERRLDVRSDLYNSCDLFSLSFPELETSLDSDVVANIKARKNYDNHMISPVCRHICCSVFIDQPLIHQNDTRSLSIMSSKEHFSSVLYNEISSLMIMSEKSFIFMILYSFLGLESVVFQINTLPPSQLMIEGISIVTLKNIVKECRKYLLMRKLSELAIEGFTSISNYRDESILDSSPRCDMSQQAFGTALSHIMLILDTSIYHYLDIMDKMQAEEEMSLANIWGNLVHQRSTLELITKLLCPSLLNQAIESWGDEVINNETNASHIYFSKSYWNSCRDNYPLGWELFDALYSKFTEFSKTPFCSNLNFLQSNPSYKYQSIFTNIDKCSQSGRIISLSNDISHLVIIRYFIQLVSQPLLSQLHDKIFLIEPSKTDAYQSIERLSENLRISIDDIWNPNHRKFDNSVIETLLSTLLWAEGRVSMLQLDEDTVFSQMIVPNYIDNSNKNNSKQQRNNVRTDIVKEFKNESVILSIPRCDEDKENILRSYEKSQSMFCKFSSDIKQSIINWYQPVAVNKNKIVKLVEKVENVDSIANVQPVDIIKVEDDPLVTVTQEIIPNEVGGTSNINLDEENDTNYYFSSPLNVKKRIDSSLLQEAKDMLHKKYNKLSEEVDNKKAKTVWLTNRIKSLNQSRTLLKQLYDTDLEDLKKLKLDKVDHNIKSYNERTAQSNIDNSTDNDSDNKVVSSAINLPESPIDLSDDQSIEYPGSRNGGIVEVLKETISADQEIKIEGRDVDISKDITQILVDTIKNDEIEVAKLISDSVDVNIETSIRVLQHPGGNSQLNLSDGTNTSLPLVSEQWYLEKIRSDIKKLKENITNANSPERKKSPKKSHLRTSIKVAQDPGGSSTLNLEDGSDNHVQKKISILKPATPPPTPPPIVIEENKEFKDLIFASIAKELISPSLDSLQQEDLIYSGMSSFPRSIVLLGKSLGLIDDQNGLSQDNDSIIDVNLIFNPISSVLFDVLGKAILKQCQCINLAALYSVINGADLLTHIENIDSIFLTSQKSDFLLNLSSCMIDDYLKFYPLTEKYTRVKRLYDVKMRVKQYNDRLWSSMLMKNTVHLILQELHVKSSLPSEEYVHFTILDNAVIDNNNDINNKVFSIDGLSALQIEYNSPWPIPAIITPIVLDNISKMTRRLLELSQLNALFRLLWCEMKNNRMRYTQTMEGKVDVNKLLVGVLDRELSCLFRSTQSIVQSIFNYFSDRIHFYRSLMRNNLINKFEKGIDWVVMSLREYSQSLGISSFQLTISEEVKYQFLITDCKQMYLSDIDSLEPTIQLKIKFNRLLECSRISLNCLNTIINTYNLETKRNIDLIRDLSIKLQMERDSIMKISGYNFDDNSYSNVCALINFLS